jgi:hypothetical protein
MYIPFQDTQERESMPTQSRTTPRRFALAVILLLSLAVPLLIPAALAQSGASSGPTTIRRDVHHDVSPPLREMIKYAPPPSLERREVEPLKRIPLPPGLAQLEEDPVRQTATVPPPTPPVSQSFEGLGNGQYGFSVTGAPPDTEGTVGATQYVQWVNTSFAIFSKSNGALIAGPTAGNTLWSGFGGGCQTNNDGDPIVLYDKLAQRWIFSQFSVSTTPYLQCIAVSTTSDATGTYNRYSFQYTDFDDYPKMSVWPDAYYETFNMFAGGTTFAGADACDSGTSLLLGKDTMSGGAEPHQPNTINSSCADGTSGTFHSDESNDRIVVSSTNGGALTHGNTVTVTATVWAWNTGSSDSLDLYYTANANSPSWVLIGTIVPPAGGAQAISRTYTLPTGSLQAVRANFRYLGSASSCSTGAYDDHEDLVFAVN